MSQNQYPPGWDEKRVREVLEYYENQTEDEAVAEAEAAFSDPNSTVMVIPHELVPLVDSLLGLYLAAKAKAPKEKAKRKRTSKKRVRA